MATQAALRPRDRPVPRPPAARWAEGAARSVSRLPSLSWRGGVQLPRTKYFRSPWRSRLAAALRKLLWGLSQSGRQGPPRGLAGFAAAAQALVTQLRGFLALAPHLFSPWPSSACWLPACSASLDPRGVGATGSPGAAPARPGAVEGRGAVGRG